MSQKLHLTLATGDYEIVRAIKEGIVKPDGIDLTVLTDMDSPTRHWRMARNREFDICEFSWSSYLLTREKSQDLTSIPVFLHRRFRHGFIFINANKGIKKPTDLIGRDVGLKNFQATALVWIRGILEEEFQVPFKEIHWKAERDEDVPFTPPPGLSLERTPAGKRVEEMLAEGELDALIHPDIISQILEGDPRVRRLFDNHKELEMAYYRKTGIFPIMHTTVIKQEVVDRYPWVPMNMLVAFEKAKQWAYQKMENPRRVPLAWFREAQEEQEHALGRDPWVYGLGAANLNNLGTLVRYSHHQGLIAREPAVKDLFDPSTWGDQWELARSRG